MASDQGSRIDLALSSLVEILVTPRRGENEDITEDRRDDAHRLAKQILDRQYDKRRSNEV